MAQVRDGLTCALAPEEVYYVRREVGRKRGGVIFSLKLSIAIVVNLATPNKRSDKFGMETRAKLSFGVK